MCVIIYKPEGTAIPENIMRKCFKANPDGAGFAFKINGRLICHKGFFTFHKFWNELEKFQKYEGVIHCRRATTGPVTSDFTHPFSIRAGYLFHNGTLPNLGTRLYSDTYILTEIVKHMKPKERYETLQDLSTRTKSRFCVLTESKIEFYGKWHNQNGLDFSSLNWLGYTPSKISKYPYNWTPGTIKKETE